MSPPKGADDYLTKPFSFGVLLARLRAIVRRGAKPRPVELRVAELVLDPATREVRRARFWGCGDHAGSSSA